jgi:DNA-binding GntR family transcriptional regulator
VTKDRKPITTMKSSALTELGVLERAAQSVYESIKEGILSNRYRPGNKLTNQDIAESLGVSRTPVRESLERLFQEGYVTRIANRGYFVAEIDVHELRELYQTREALELYSLRLVVETGSALPVIAQLEETNARYRSLCVDTLSRERLVVDSEFHLLLAKCSGNGYLHRSLASIFDRLILKRRIEGFHDVRGLTPYQDHVRIIEAIKNEDLALATQVLGEHIQGACARFTQYLEPRRMD